jgi:two-component system, OmpR family, sensor histidine kinase KdpD
MKTKTNFNFSTEKQYFFSTIILMVFIAILYEVQNIIGYETVSLILLLIIFLLPILNFDRGPIIVSAVISALAWDYYFIPPHFTMHIAKTADVVMLLMFFIVAVTNSILTSRLKEQKNSIMIKEKKLNSLYNLLKTLSQANNLEGVLNALVSQIQEIFEYKTVIYFPEKENRLKRVPHVASNFEPEEMDWLAAEASFKTGNISGRGTNTVTGADGIYFPITLDNSVFCVIGVLPDEKLKHKRNQMEFLKAFIEEIIPFLKKYSTYSNP